MSLTQNVYEVGLRLEINPPMHQVPNRQSKAKAVSCQCLYLQGFSNWNEEMDLKFWLYVTQRLVVW